MVPARVYTAQPKYSGLVGERVQRLPGEAPAQGAWVNQEQCRRVSLPVMAA
jgi:hypothetical protein